MRLNLVKTLHITIIALLSVTLLSGGLVYADPQIIAQLEAKIAELEAKINELKEDKQNKNAKIDELRDKLKAKNNQTENQDVKLQAKLENKNAKIDRLENKIVKLEEIIDRKDSKIDRKDTNVDKKKEKLGIAQDDLNAQASEIESLKGTLQNQTSIIESMKTQMGENNLGSQTHTIEGTWNDEMVIVNIDDGAIQSVFLGISTHEYPTDVVEFYENGNKKIHIMHIGTSSGRSDEYVTFDENGNKKSHFDRNALKLYREDGTMKIAYYWDGIRDQLTVRDYYESGMKKSQLYYDYDGNPTTKYYQGGCYLDGLIEQGKRIKCTSEYYQTVLPDRPVVLTVDPWK